MFCIISISAKMSPRWQLIQPIRCRHLLSWQTQLDRFVVLLFFYQKSANHKPLFWSVARKSIRFTGILIYLVLFFVVCGNTRSCTSGPHKNSIRQGNNHTQLNHPTTPRFPTRWCLLSLPPPLSNYSFRKRNLYSPWLYFPNSKPPLYFKHSMTMPWVSLPSCGHHHHHHYPPVMMLAVTAILLLLVVASPPPSQQIQRRALCTKRADGPSTVTTCLAPSLVRYTDWSVSSHGHIELPIFPATTITFFWTKKETNLNIHMTSYSCILIMHSNRKWRFWPLFWTQLLLYHEP